MRRRFSTRPLEGVDLSGQVRCEICEARRLRNSSCLVPLVMSIPRWLWESSEGCGIFGFPEAEFLPNSDSVCLTKQKPAEFLDHEKKRFLRSTKTDGIFSLRLHIYDMRTHERLNSPIFRQMPFYQNWLTWEGMTSANKIIHNMYITLVNQSEVLASYHSLVAWFTQRCIPEVTQMHVTWTT